MLQAIDEYFDVLDFGSPAVYTPNGGSPKSIVVILDAPFHITSAQGIEYQSAEPQCVCKTSDVSDANDQGTIQIQNVTYNIREVEPDNNGFTRLILTRDPN